MQEEENPTSKLFADYVSSVNRLVHQIVSSAKDNRAIPLDVVFKAQSVAKAQDALEKHMRKRKVISEMQDVHSGDTN